jgi:Flp pilus assembly protein TadG
MNQNLKRVRTVICRRDKGAALVEFAIALILFIPLMLGFYDFFMLIFSSQLNDSVCQDAARVASIGEPSTAQARAAAIVARANAQSKSTYQLLSVTSTASSTISQQGGPVAGNVTVVTATVFKPQTLQWIYPAITLRSQQTYPFTYVPSSSATSNGS